jgi:hypothetical protein
VWRYRTANVVTSSIAAAQNPAMTTAESAGFWCKRFHPETPAQAGNTAMRGENATALIGDPLRRTATTAHPM